MASSLTRIFRFISISAAGLILGVGFWRASDLGYFQHWKQLSEKPKDVPGYLGTAGSPIHLQPPSRITSPCDFSTPEFSLLTNPPREIVDCVQRLDIYADGDVRVTYVIDSGGNIWKWTLSRSVYTEAEALISSTCSGLLIGIVAALLAEGLKIYVERQEPFTAKLEVRVLREGHPVNSVALPLVITDWLFGCSPYWYLVVHTGSL